jgi:hypothetical protein
MKDEKIELTEVEASGGIKLHVLRYMLFASTALVIVGLAIVVYWISSKPT